MMTNAYKEAIIRASRHAATLWANDLDFNPEACCLLHAATLVVALEELGERAILQAGSMTWPRIQEHEDDGKINTHFSYVFDMTPAAAMAKVMNGEMPEMHCWVAIPPKTIIDPTTKYLKAQCTRLTAMHWTGADPPDYLWCDYDSIEWPSGVAYRADRLAISLAMLMLDNLAQQRMEIEQ